MADRNPVFAKIAWRLIPFLILLYVTGFIDRTNVGFAALTMNRDLGFTPTVFGFGAGMFFLGYVAVQVPAAVSLARLGARRIVCAIMLIWGLISAFNAFVTGPSSFYVLRFLLGVAEAGFTPSMIYYLTLWFPQAYRGRFTAAFCCAIPLAGIISGPLSGLILGMEGIAGLHGWQWLFLIQGAPSILLALVVLRWLPDGPRDAAWLSEAEKTSVHAQLAGDMPAENPDLWQALGDRRLWLMGLSGFGSACALYGTTLWLPQMIQAMGFSNRTTGFVAALPYVASIVAMVAWGRLSDAGGERIWHAAQTMIVAAVAFVGASLAPNAAAALFALTVAMAGGLAGIGPFQSLLSSFSRGTAAAGGIALVNTIGTLGGFFGPVLIGAIRTHTGGYGAAMAVLALAQGLSAIAVLAAGRKPGAARL